MRTRRVTVRTAALVVGVAAIVGIVVGVGTRVLDSGGTSYSDTAVPRLQGQATWPPGARPAPDFALSDQEGRRVTLASLRGRTVVLAFLDSIRRSRPAEVRSLAASLSLLPRSERPVLLVVSVDPWRDTRSSVRAAAKRWRLTTAADWHWLLGSRSELAGVWGAYRIKVHRRRGEVAHTPAVYVIDRSGFERAGLLYPFPPSWPAADVRALADEG
jgi:protein SCO1